jgi:peroxiredoxin Q/BCP
MTKAMKMGAALLAAAGMNASAAELKIGMKAPGFSAQDQNGKTIQLADFRGKSTVVLYFYPKDDTPGCTAEACSLRDGYGAIQATGAVVLGVSADDVKSHAAFAAKFSLPFSLLADPKHRIIQAYGVKMPLLSMAKRWTFIIDRQGVIRYIVQDVRTKDHDKQVLELVKGM